MLSATKEDKGNGEILNGKRARIFAATCRLSFEIIFSCTAACHPSSSLAGKITRLNLARSVILHIDLSAAPSPTGKGGLDAARKAWLPARVGSLGWEPNAAGRPGPRIADLSSVLDPSRLAENSVRLNIKLMRWRALPNLDVDLLSRTKCLLLGAGTKRIGPPQGGWTHEFLCYERVFSRCLSQLPFPVLFLVQESFSPNVSPSLSVAGHPIPSSHENSIWRRFSCTRRDVGLCRGSVPYRVGRSAHHIRGQR